MLNCESTFNELSQFTSDILSIRKPIIDDRLEVLGREDWLQPSI